MAEVGVVFKVYPKEGQFDHVIDGLRKMDPRGMSTEDVGFGIKVIKVLFVFNDENMSSSRIEESVKRLTGVSEVEVMEESLM